MRERVDLRLPPELLARVHAARGSETFTAFVERALRVAVGEPVRVPVDPLDRVAAFRRATARKR